MTLRTKISLKLFGKISFFGHKRLLKLCSKPKILKVKEKKVSLFFGLDVKWLSYGQLEILAQFQKAFMTKKAELWGELKDFSYRAKKIVVPSIMSYDVKMVSAQLDSNIR